MNYLDKYTSQGEEYEKVAQQERLIIKVAETICVEAERQEKSLTKLAGLLSKGKSWVSQTLGGDKNMTLKTLSDFAYSLNMDVDIKLTPHKVGGVWVTEQNESITLPFSANAHVTNVVNLSDHREYKEAS